MVEITKENLICIINTAIEQYLKSENTTYVYTMDKFASEYFKEIQQNPQNSLFDTTRPSLDDVKNARGLCKIMADYKEYLNICLYDENAEFSEESYRTLYRYLQANKKYISNDNERIYKSIESTIHQRLPEFKKTEKINTFNEDALRIIKMKKDDKNKTKDYQKYADRLFEDLSKNKDILQIEADEQKLALFENCIAVVNCLSDKYKKTTKFEYKMRLYDAIEKTAIMLGNKEKANKAKLDKERFKKAIESANHHVSDYHKAKTDINQQRKDEYLYK